MKTISTVVALALALSAVSASETATRTRNIPLPSPTGAPEVRNALQGIGSNMTAAIRNKSQPTSRSIGSEDSLPKANLPEPRGGPLINFNSSFQGNLTLFREAKSSLVTSILGNRDAERQLRLQIAQDKVAAATEATARLRAQRELKKLENTLEREQKRDEKLSDRLGRDLERVFLLQNRIPARRNETQQARNARIEKLEQKAAELMTRLANGDVASRNITRAIAEGRVARIDMAGEMSRIRYVVSTNGVPSIRVKWVRLDANGTESAEYTSRVRLHRLTEVDGTRSLRNTTARNLMFPNMNGQWSPITIQDITDDVTGASYKQVKTSLAPGGQFGSLNITLTVNFATDTTPLDDGSVIQPNGYKYSLNIKGWPYTFTQGRLALVKHVATTSTNVAADASSGQVSLDNGVGEFNWDSDVLADGVPGTVDLLAFHSDSSVASVGADTNEDTSETNYRAVFVFPPRANEINWDPEQSVSESSALSFTANSDTASTTTANDASHLKGGMLAAAASALFSLFL